MSEQQVALVLLQEFRAFRDSEFREFRDENSAWREASGKAITRLETQVCSAITGSEDSPSRLSVVESKVSSLDRLRWWASGIAFAVGSVIGAAVKLGPMLLAHK